MADSFARQLLQAGFQQVAHEINRIAEEADARRNGTTGNLEAVAVPAARPKLRLVGRDE